MKKICIITHHFYPEINPRSFRATELADELARRKYDVTLIYGNIESVYYNYNEDKKSNIEADFKLKNKEITYSIFRRIKLMFSTFFLGEPELKTKAPFFKTLNKEIENADVVISIGCPFYIHFHIGKLLKEIPKKPITIMDWGDPFYNKKNRFHHAKYIEKIQQDTIDQFEYVVFPIEEAREYYKKYKENDMLRVIPQGFKIEKKSSEKEEFFVENTVPTFIYAGAFYRKIRNPKKLLEALSKIEMDFKLCIYTDKFGYVYKNVLAPYEKKLGQKLAIESKIPRDVLMKRMIQADFLLNLENTVSQQSPSKMIDMAISKTPILSLNPDAINDEKLTKFISGDYTGAEYVNLELYKIENVVTKFEEMFEKANGC